MALPPHVLLAFLTLGASLVVGYAAHLLFRRYRVSDVLILLGFGIAIGLTVRPLDPASVAPLFAVLAPLGLVLVLFEGGLELGWRELRHVAPRAVATALGTWAITTAALFAVASLALGLSPQISLLLAVALAGPGVTAMLPLLPQLRLPADAKAYVTIETSLGSLLNGASTTAVVAVLLAHASPLAGVGIVGAKFVVGAAVGVLGGVLAARFLAAVGPSAHTYSVTLAALLLVYVATETLGGSGYMMALTFGLVVGNAHALRTEGQVPRLETLSPASRVHNVEAVFVFRSVYFVYMGAVVAPLLIEPRYAIGGVAIVATVFALRAILLGALRLGAPDASAATTLFFVGLVPRGLSTAIGASFPVTVGLAGAADFLPYVVYAILAGNVIMSATMIAHDKLQARADAAAPAPVAPAALKAH